ncbi:hypothetical protein JTE90_028370 [Oedothorax gibbosus]|uniref:Uncharacterized protein n=1 Tax=Oedothorax gibbosus TaxID=931172 RepID=A0AAV6VE88_9ARAC|nr:hypothetical protein JTE90_028370 [Oedothorax gibbosus]
MLPKGYLSASTDCRESGLTGPIVPFHFLPPDRTGSRTMEEILLGFFSWSKQLWPSCSFFFVLTLAPFTTLNPHLKVKVSRTFGDSDSSDGTAMGQLMPREAAPNISPLPQFPILHDLERLDPTRCPQMKTFSRPYLNCSVSWNLGSLWCSNPEASAGVLCFFFSCFVGQGGLENEILCNDSETSLDETAGGQTQQEVKKKKKYSDPPPPFHVSKETLSETKGNKTVRIE